MPGEDWEARRQTATEEDAKNERSPSWRTSLESDIYGSSCGSSSLELNGLRRSISSGRPSFDGDSSTDDSERQSLRRLASGTSTTDSDCYASERFRAGSPGALQRGNRTLIRTAGACAFKSPARGVSPSSALHSGPEFRSLRHAAAPFRSLSVLKDIGAASGAGWESVPSVDGSKMELSDSPKDANDRMELNPASITFKSESGPVELPAPIMDERNRLYEVLGLSRSFTDIRELRCAYRREALKYHPDRVSAAISGNYAENERYRAFKGKPPKIPESPESSISIETIRRACADRFQEIQLAFQTLSDPTRRRIYDTFGYRCVKDQRLMNMVIQLSAHFRTTSFRGKQYRKQQQRMSKQNASTTSDASSTDASNRYGFTGAGGPAFAWWDNGCSAERATRRGLTKCLGKPLPYTVPVDLFKNECLERESAVLPGCNTQAPNTQHDRNPSASHTASDIIHEIFVDLADFYKGRSLRIGVERKGFSLSATRCVEECYLTVDIEPGMRDGDRIIFPGCADATEPGAEPGRVVIVVREKMHARFHRIGDDLWMRKRISLAEALCGFSFTIKLVDGRTIMVQSHEGCIIRPGCIRRITGKGMPKRGQTDASKTVTTPRAFGDLFIDFDVYWPRDGAVTGKTKEQVLSALATLGPRTWERRRRDPLSGGASVESPCGYSLSAERFNEGSSTDEDEDDEEDEADTEYINETLTAEHVPAWLTSPLRRPCQLCIDSAMRKEMRS